MNDRINTVKEKVGKSVQGKLDAQVEDLANQARHDNLVFLNIPKGREGAADGGNQANKCTSLIKEILTENLQFDGKAIDIDRAHRSRLNVKCTQ